MPNDNYYAEINPGFDERTWHEAEMTNNLVINYY